MIFVKITPPIMKKGVCYERYTGVCEGVFRAKEMNVKGRIIRGLLKKH
jgi:hypothetical protein